MLKRNSKRKAEDSGDPFDRLYKRWAEDAIDKHLEPPSREMWDKIVLLLILSKDPERVAAYKRIDAEGPGSLGSDAYALWRKVPGYMAGRSTPFTDWADFNEYRIKHEGLMRQAMEREGVGERYRAILEEAAARKAQARRGQVGVLIIGCIGLSFIAFMVLTVLLIIGLKFMG